MCIGGSLYLTHRAKDTDADHQYLARGSLSSDNLALKSVNVIGFGKDARKLSKDSSDVVNMACPSEYEWIKTMCIDNPIHPFRNLYKKKLDAINAGAFVTSDDMRTIFKRTRKSAYIGAGVSFLVFFIVIPAVALSQTVLSKTELETWMSVCQYWCLAITVLVVVVPPVQECLQIWRQIKANKEKKDSKRTKI